MTSPMCSPSGSQLHFTYTRMCSLQTASITSPVISSHTGQGRIGGSPITFLKGLGGYYGGTLNEFRVQGNYRPTARFSISVSETWDRFRLPLPNGNFSVVLASLQANYSFNRFLTFTSLVQMDTSNTQAVSANLRLRYNYRPDSDLYVIYNVGTQFASIAPANPPQGRETRFAVKWTYSFSP
jgi:hypothetical protein